MATGQSDDLRDRSLGELMRQLADETTTLVRQEIELARAEITQKVDTAKAEAAGTAEVARSELGEQGRRVKDELVGNAKKAGTGLGLWGAAAAFALLTLGTLTAFFILALDGAMPNWAAALIVAAVYAVVTAALFALGRQRVREAQPLVSERTLASAREGVGGIVARGKEGARQVGPPVPEQTVETIKEDVEWAKTRRESARK